MDENSIGDYNTVGGDGQEKNLDLSIGNMPTMDEPSTDSLGRIDRYELTEKLGAGGFGAVYRARDTIAQIDVAVKVLPPMISAIPEELENVRSNFALVSKLKHPNIASLEHLHKVQKADAAAQERLRVFPDSYLVVMEYVTGSTLSNWRKQFSDRKVPPDRAVNICAQVAQALDFAHSKKIIHRDVKPSNIMISPEGDVKVLDFGLAAEIRSSMGRVSQEQFDTSGTRPYMAPEQWAGKHQGPETDQYALACMFYELISGKVPFQSVFDTGDTMLMMNVIKSESVEPLSELTKKQNLILKKALAKTPEERFASCTEFIGALGGDKVKITRRNSTGGKKSSRSVIAVVIFLIVIVGLGFGGYIGYSKYMEIQKAKAEQLAKEKAAEEERQRQEQLARETREKLNTLKVKLDSAFRSGNFSIASSAAADILAIDSQNAYARQMQARIKEKAGLSETAPIKSRAEIAFESISPISSEHGFGQRKTNLRLMLKTADNLYEAKSYGDALGKYQDLITGCRNLKKLDSERNSAVAATKKLETNRKVAEKNDSVKLAKKVWNNAEKLKDSGKNKFSKGDFSGAVKSFAAANKEYRHATQYARGTYNLSLSKETFNKSLLSRNIERAELDKFGGSYWADARLALLRADKAAASEQWEQAMAEYQTATKLIPKAVETAKAGILKMRRNRFEQAMTVADKSMKNHQWEQAVVKFKEALKIPGYRDSKVALEGIKTAQGHITEFNALVAKAEKAEKNQLLWQAERLYEKAKAVKGYESNRKIALILKKLKDGLTGTVKSQKLMDQATCYEYGLAGKVDKKLAAKLYKQAAGTGYPSAQLYEAYCYLYGRLGFEELPQKANEIAKKCFPAALKLAESGDPIAQLAVGIAYETCCFPHEEGADYKQTASKAMYWYKKAAEKDNADAMNQIAMLYGGLKGVEGIKLDYAKTREWSHKAAEKGHVVAIHNLGSIYDGGVGVKKDYVKALRWYKKAAEKDYIDAITCIGFIYSKGGYGVDKDYSKALKWFTKAADNGGVCGMMNIARMYKMGYGVKKDYSKALEWYKKAAGKGSAYAMNGIANLYYKGGYGIDQNYAKAMEWYKKAAANYNIAAISNIGYMYQHGYGVKKDTSEAIKWYKKAAEKGNTSSMIKIGNYYYYGADGITKDDVKAIEWYEKAAKKGNTTGLYNVGKKFYKGEGVEKNFAEALKWLKQAAEKGNDRALSDIGDIYFYGGNGVDKNYVKALEWFKKAAGKGNRMSMYMIGYIYYLGTNGVDKDYAKALEWYKKAADKGLATAMYDIGRFYNYGYGVKKDYTKALEWYKKAAENGEVKAMNTLGRFYSWGIGGLKKDYTKAMEWYKKAAAKGDKLSINNIAFMYKLGNGVQKDYSKALEWYEKLADKGDSVAMHSIAMLYYIGGEGLPKNYFKAFDWFKKAADAGNSYSMNMIGQLYLNGKGFAKNYSKAMEWYKKAADNGNTSALGNIGYMYQNGYGVSKSSHMALLWYKKGAGKGNTTAMKNIANVYKYGLGVTKDYSKAMEWYTKAADKGDTRAMNSIAQFYKYGQGVDKDYTTAVEWYKKAAKRGNTLAMNNLGFTYTQGGYGITKNYDKAMEWYKKAADKGSAPAMTSIGLMYQNGHGVAKNYMDAMSWFLKASKKKNSNAMYSIGILYLQGGYGIKKNSIQARLWFQKSYDNSTFSYQKKRAQDMLNKL